jgi:hypothetical protein
VTKLLDKGVALLKSLAAECEGLDGDEHAWRRCRHCLAVEALEQRGRREELRAVIELIGRLPAKARE